MTTWSRITEWPQQGRATWAVGVLGRVLASGKAKSAAEARRAAAPFWARLKAQLAAAKEATP